MDEVKITNTSQTIDTNAIPEVAVIPEESSLLEVTDGNNIESEDIKNQLLYNVSDRTPIHIAIFCAFQQVLIGLSTSLAVSSFVADVTCASEFPDIKTDLLSTTLLMNGLTTLMIVTIGTRIPLFQGACADYVVPLLAIQLVNKDFCKLSEPGNITNLTLINGSDSKINATLDNVHQKRELAFTKLQEFQGCLILVGVIHALVGATGTVGFLLRFIGPITVVPTNLLSGIFLSRATVKFSRAHWGIAALPVWNAIFQCRDFYSISYCNKTSILDSIGDYYACARVCNVPPPLRHAVNRGIAVEGFGSTLSGLFGCGHATTTSGGNIGALGVTKVASRDVFWYVSLIYIVFGLVGKVSAVFITIPLPVLGGAMIVMFAMFNGVVLSNLQVVSLSSTRNMAVMGSGLLMGLMIPYWLEAFPEDIDTGSPYYDNILKTLLLNPNLCGGLTACFLDNTVPDTLKERGITAWQDPDKGDNFIQYSEGLDVYNPLIPTRWMSWRVMKYIPFCVYRPLRTAHSNGHIE